MSVPSHALPSEHPLTEAARQWLAALQRCVRAVDYEGAEALVDPGVLAFGTYASIVAGRSALRREQWERVWRNTFARALQGSNSIEGINASLADAVAIVDEERPETLKEETSRC